jgi:hypothetical protein
LNKFPFQFAKTIFLNDIKFHDERREKKVQKSFQFYVSTINMEDFFYFSFFFVVDPEKSIPIRVKTNRNLLKIQYLFHWNDA